MNEVLTGIERDVVIEYMRRESPNMKVCASAEEDASFDLKKGEYTITQTAVIFPARLVPKWMQYEKPSVSVTFYFNRRGLRFSSVLQTKGANAAFVIASAIEKVNDTVVNQSESNVQCKLYYNTNTNTSLRTPILDEKNYVNCISTSAFLLFNHLVWQNIDISNEELFFAVLERHSCFRRAELPRTLEELMRRSGKLLFVPQKRIPQMKPFPYDACLTTDDLRGGGKLLMQTIADELSLIPDFVYMPLGKSLKLHVVSLDSYFFGNENEAGNEELSAKTEAQLAFLPACSYVSRSFEQEGAVQNRIEPIELLYITDTVICFGCPVRTIRFTEGQEYFLCMKIGMRKIVTGVRVDHVLEVSERTGAVCAFTSLKAEDRRFLYERHYGVPIG